MPQIDCPTSDTFVNWGTKGLEGAVNIVTMLVGSHQLFRPPQLELLKTCRDRLIGLVDRIESRELPPT